MHLRSLVEQFGEIIYFISTFIANLPRFLPNKACILLFVRRSVTRRTPCHTKKRLKKIYFSFLIPKDDIYPLLVKF